MSSCEGEGPGATPGADTSFIREERSGRSDRLDQVQLPSFVGLCGVASQIERAARRAVLARIPVSLSLRGVIGSITGFYPVGAGSLPAGGTSIKDRSAEQRLAQQAKPLCGARPSAQMQRSFKPRK